MGNILCKKNHHRQDINANVEEEIPPTQDSISAEEIESHVETASEPAEEQLEDAIIDDIVARFMKNQRINSKLLPDFLEKQIYKNILRLVIGVTKDTIENVEFTILGHKINLVITPLRNEPIVEQNSHVNL